MKSPDQIQAEILRLQGKAVALKCAGNVQASDLILERVLGLRWVLDDAQDAPDACTTGCPCRHQHEQEPREAKQ